jgi:TatD DNase family protein
MLVDSHCHLDFPDFAERLDSIVAAAREAGVGRMVTISTHVARFGTYRALADQGPEIFCSVGTHPHNAAVEPDIPAADIASLSRHPRCIAIGEAGLDYFYDKSPRDVQRRVFLSHIAAARETGLPLVIHARDADADMIEILTEEMGRGRFDAVLHCFSSGAELAEVGVKLGLYVSFSGIVSFKKSDELRRVARAVPDDRILVETDAPYLAPEPFRGKTNEPAYVRHTAAALARDRGMSEEAFARTTTANFYRLFSKAAAIDGIAAEAAA